MEHLEHPVVGASNPYAINNVTSIRTGLGAQWEYSPWFQGAWLLKQTCVVLTGKRADDYVAAETATKSLHVPRVTVWHHIFDWNAATGKCTMQLVSWNIHVSTVPHAGGCWQYSNYYRVPYKASHPEAGELEKLAERQETMKMPDSLRYSAQELSEFSVSTGRQLSPELKQLFNGQRAISKKGRAALVLERDLCMDALLPLTDMVNSAHVTAVMARLEHSGTALPPDATAIPFAIDPYGNEFWTGETGEVHFYDHETDKYQSACLSLSDILD